jgi:xanthine dehydrogenase accessory factor
MEVLHTGIPRELNFDAISDEKAWDVGLSCGGRIQIWLEPDPVSRDPDLWAAVCERIDRDEPTVLVLDKLSLSSALWVPGTPDPSGGVVREAYNQRKSGAVEFNGKSLFINVLAARDRLVIVGSVHIAIPLVRFAKDLGFETIVIDPRSALATSERYPTEPDRLVVAWPEVAFQEVALTPDTYVAVLTHDPKIDDIALRIVLESPAAYIGALGSRVTQSKRRATLESMGVTEAQLARIHGPIGLNIGARTPEEIALSIMAEVVQVRRSSRKPVASL